MQTQLLLLKALWGDKLAKENENSQGEAVDSFLELADLVTCRELSSEFNSIEAGEKLRYLLKFLVKSKNDSSFSKAKNKFYRAILREHGIVITNIGDIFISYDNDKLAELLKQYSDLGLKYFLASDVDLERASSECKNIGGYGKRGVRLRKELL